LTIQHRAQPKPGSGGDPHRERWCGSKAIEMFMEGVAATRQMFAQMVSFPREMLAQVVAIVEDMHLEICQIIGEQNRE
jgi:hypothetical protein